MNLTNIASIIKDGVKIVQSNRYEVERATEYWQRALILYVVGASPSMGLWKDSLPCGETLQLSQDLLPTMMTILLLDLVAWRTGTHGGQGRCDDLGTSYYKQQAYYRQAMGVWF